MIAIGKAVKRKTSLWGITMNSTGFQYSFGPVPSRRLGKSLGINNIPSKVCTYSCLYCQVGRTTDMTTNRRFFYQPGEIFRDVQERLAKTKETAETVDYLTLMPLYLRAPSAERNRKLMEAAAHEA